MSLLTITSSSEKMRTIFPEETLDPGRTPELLATCQWMRSVIPEGQKVSGSGSLHGVLRSEPESPLGLPSLQLHLFLNPFLTSVIDHRDRISWALVLQHICDVLHGGNRLTS